MKTYSAERDTDEVTIFAEAPQGLYAAHPQLIHPELDESQVDTIIGLNDFPTFSGCLPN